MLLLIKPYNFIHFEGAFGSTIALVHAPVVSLETNRVVIRNNCVDRDRPAGDNTLRTAVLENQDEFETFSIYSGF